MDVKSYGEPSRNFRGKKETDMSVVTKGPEAVLAFKDVKGGLHKTYEEAKKAGMSMRLEEFFSKYDPDIKEYGYSQTNNSLRARQTIVKNWEELKKIMEDN